MNTKITLNDLGYLFTIGFNHIQCREFLEAVSGYKISRLILKHNQIEPLRALARKHSLITEFSSFGIQEPLIDEGKGEWYNTGSKVNKEHGYIYCYLGRNKKDVLQAKECESGQEDSYTLGNLLKIPVCCTEFFVSNKEKALNNYFDEYAPITSKVSLREQQYQYSSKINYLAQYFGYSLIHHYPCSWNCQASIERANDSLKLISSVSKEWANTFVENTTGIIIFENNTSVHFIKKKEIIKKERNLAVYFTPNEFKSTNATKLGKKLRKEGVLEWQEQYPFLYPSEEIEHSSTIIIPFIK